MNKILIVDASASDGRIMSNLLTKAGYAPVVVEGIEAGKKEAAELPTGTVILTTMRLKGGTAIEFIDWLKIVGLRHRVIVILDTFSATEIYSIMRGHGAVDIIQRPAMDKMLVETVRKYSQNNGIIDKPRKKDISCTVGRSDKNVENDES